MSISVLVPAAPRLIERFWPELVPCPSIVIVAFVSCSVAVTVTLLTVLSTFAVYPVVFALNAGLKEPGDTLNADRLLLLAGAARFTVMRYVLSFPFGATTIISISVLSPAGFREMVRAWPELVPWPFTVMLAFESALVAVTEILSTPLPTFSVYAIRLARNVGLRVPCDTVKPDRLLFPPRAARLTVTV
jgi:hypothetical protein